MCRLGGLGVGPVLEDVAAADEVLDLGVPEVGEDGADLWIDSKGFFVRVRILEQGVTYTGEGIKRAPAIQGPIACGPRSRVCLMQMQSAEARFVNWFSI